MRYASAKLSEAERTEVWRIYVADTLRCQAIGISKLSGTGYPQQRYSDLMKPAVPERDGEEIVAEVFGKLGIGVR